MAMLLLGRGYTSSNMGRIRTIHLRVLATAFFAASAVVPAQSSDVATLAAQVSELKAKVAYLSDRQQIHDVYLRYTRGFDRNDVDLMRSAFWPNVQINYGRESDTFDEFVIRHLKRHTDTLKSWGHLLTNESVDLSADVAHVESYITRLASRNKDGRSDIIAVRYIDRVERHNGEWRISVREVIPYFLTETDTALDAYIQEPGYSGSPCGMGTWDRRDPSYLRPLKPRLDGAVGPICGK